MAEGGPVWLCKFVGKRTYRRVGVQVCWVKEHVVSDVWHADAQVCKAA